MRRSLLVVTIVVALAALAVQHVVPRAGAQDAVTAAAGHPLVGAWFWENISDDPFDDSYAVFDSDGNYVEETTYIGAGIGAWQPTGDRTADLIIVYQDIEGGLDPNKPAAFVPGTVKMWLDIDVAADGDHLTATGPVEIRSADGTLVDQFTFNGTATRLGVGWVKPAATPAA